MDPATLEAAITPRTKVVLPVHLYGHPANMEAILAVAGRHGLPVLEDAAQAHGAAVGGRRAGSLGHAACFSFYPGKNLGAFGEAGAVTTNDAEIARKIRMIRDHGQSQKYYHDIEGYNGRLDALQAGILHKKLKRLSEGNEKRRQSARLYNQLLSQIDGIITPYEPDWSRAVYHLYVIRTNDRDKLQKHLTEKQIGTGLHYPLPLHLQKAYEYLGYKEGDFPVSEKVASELLSLPMFPGLLDSQQKYVATLLHKS